MSLRGWLTDLRLGLATEAGSRRAAGAEDVAEGVTRVRTLGRYDLFAPSRDLSLLPALAQNGRIDPWTGRLIARHLRPGMVVADVGANLGYFTMLMADRVGADGRVLAFEPNEELCGLIRRSAAANAISERLTVHATALGDIDGRVMNFVTPGDHLAGAAVWDADREHPSARRVTTRRLDAIPGADRIAFAKIDAEGFEPQIWAGMSGLLAGPVLRTIVLEFTAGAYADPAGFVAAIRAAGFTIALVDRERGPVAIRDETLAGFAPGEVVNVLLMR